MKNYQVFLFIGIVVVCFSSIYAVNYLNIVNSKKDGGPLRCETTVKTSDDPSYLSPVKNYLKGKHWKDNAKGVHSYYLRTPGYSLFCLPFYKFLPEKKALFAIRLLQSLLLSLAAGLLFLLLKQWKVLTVTAVLFSLPIGLIPAFSGYVFYTLTEGVTPILLFTLFYFYARPAALSNGTFTFLLSCLVFGFLFLTRPVFGVFVVLIFSLYVGLKVTSGKKILILLIGIVFAFGPMFTWEYRNASYGKKWTGINSLHAIYGPSNHSIWRAPHQAIYDLVKQYNINGSEYHQWNKKLEKGANDHQSFSSLEEPLSIFNEQVIDLLGADTMQHYIQLYYRTLDEIPFHAKHNRYSETELLLVSKFQEFKTCYQSNYPFRAHVITPLRVLKSIVWQLHLNQFQFWNTYQHAWWLRPLCWISVFLNLMIHVLPCGYVLLNLRACKKYWGLVIPVVIYLFYLIYAQRGLEQRYSYPLLTVFYACSLWIAVQHKKSIKLPFLFKSRNSSNVRSSNE